MLLGQQTEILDNHQMKRCLIQIVHQLDISHYQYYQKRGDIETDHRSLKQNASLTTSPCSTETAQLNHVALSLLAYSRLEQLKIVHKNNHYAMKRKLLIAANQASYEMYLKMKHECEKLKSA